MPQCRAHAGGPACVARRHTPGSPLARLRVSKPVKSPQEGVKNPVAPIKFRAGDSKDEQLFPAVRYCPSITSGTSQMMLCRLPST